MNWLHQKREGVRSTGTTLSSSTPGGSSSPSINSILEKVQDVNASGEQVTAEDAVRYSLKDVTEGVDVEAI